MDWIDKSKVPWLEAKGLLPVIERARSEGWDRLALLGPGTRFVADTWSDRAWRPRKLPKRALQRLATLTTLRMLALPGWHHVRHHLGMLVDGLPDLTALDVGFTDQSDDIAPTIARLKALTRLDLAHTQLGPAGLLALSAIPGLTYLDLWQTRIRDGGGQALTRFHRLKTLHLPAAGIDDAGAKALATLKSLRRLELSGNRIGDAGMAALLDAWADRYRASEADIQLDLRSQRTERTSLPPEIINNTDTRAMLAAWRRYRAENTQQRLLNEAKLIVVGNEAVGKTSLIRFLTSGRHRDPDEQKTPGAEIERIETKAWHPAGSDVTLNVWDFGGQEIMHGTHRFFLTERSLYLLLLEARREDSGRTIYDWLKTIRNHGGRSPVLVIINKCDDGADNLGLDETAIQRAYPEVVGVLRTSCNDDPPSRERVATLRRTIVEVIRSHPQLKHVRDPMPNVWLEIKDALAEKARARKVLEFGEFAALCETGCGAEAVDDPHEQRALMKLLNDLGVVVAHGWRRGSTRTAGITLLDPNWLTGAIYRLLNSQTVLDQRGELTWDQLPAVLDDAALYPAERHRYIMDMMEHRDIAMCFELPATKATRPRFLIPEALPPNEPPGGRRPTGDALHFRFEYAFLPPNLIPRFIVEAHRCMPVDAARWRTGVVLTIEGCQVRVSANRDTRVVDVTVTGPAQRRRSALNVARHMLDTVHLLNPEAEPEARVPLPDDLEQSVSYPHLLKLERKYGSDHRVDPEGLDDDRDYGVGDLLDGVRDPQGDARRAAGAFTINNYGSIGALSHSGDIGRGIAGGRLALSGAGPAHVGDMRAEVSITADTPVSQTQAEQFQHDIGEVLHMVVDRLKSLAADQADQRATLAGMLPLLAQLQAIESKGRTHGEVADAVVQVAAQPGEAPSATAQRLGAFIEGVGASAAATGLLKLLGLVAG